jgi:hypothetical protein
MWIHHGNMIVSGEAWRLLKETHPERDFSDFWLEVSLKFSINCFDLSSFFLRSSFFVKIRVLLLRIQVL